MLDHIRHSTTTKEMPTGILLAAGLGRRYDPTGRQSKLNVILDSGMTVMESSATSMRQALSRVVLVVRSDDAETQRVSEITDCELLVCPDAGRGMGFVLSFAIEHTTNAPGWVVGLADMPYVMSGTISRIGAEVVSGHAIVAPVYHGRRGNPVGFDATNRDQLLRLSGDIGARELIKNRGYFALQAEDRGVLLDIDTTDDLQV